MLYNAVNADKNLISLSGKHFFFDKSRQTEKNLELNFKILDIKQTFFMNLLLEIICKFS